MRSLDGTSTEKARKLHWKFNLNASLLFWAINHDGEDRHKRDLLGFDDVESFVQLFGGFFSGQKRADLLIASRPMDPNQRKKGGKGSIKIAFSQLLPLIARINI